MSVCLGVQKHFGAQGSCLYGYPTSTILIMPSKIMSINQLSCASLLMLQCFKIKIIEVCFGYSWEGMDKLSTAPNSRVQFKHFLYFSSKSAGLHEWWLARKPLKYWACISLHSCYLTYCFQSSMTNPLRCVQILDPFPFLSWATLFGAVT